MSGSKPLRPSKRKKSAATADFTKTIADARAKVAKAKTDAFMARLEAIDTILEDAEPYDVLMLCAHALAHAMPLCCENSMPGTTTARSGDRGRPKRQHYGTRC